MRHIRGESRMVHKYNGESQEELSRSHFAKWFTFHLSGTTPVVSLVKLSGALGFKNILPSNVGCLFLPRKNLPYANEHFMEYQTGRCFRAHTIPCKQHKAANANKQMRERMDHAKHGGGFSMHVSAPFLWVHYAHWQHSNIALSFATTPALICTRSRSAAGERKKQEVS